MYPPDFFVIIRIPFQRKTTWFIVLFENGKILSVLFLSGIIKSILPSGRSICFAKGRSFLISTVFVVSRYPFPPDKKNSKMSFACSGNLSLCSKGEYCFGPHAGIRVPVATLCIRGRLSIPAALVIPAFHPLPEDIIRSLPGYVSYWQIWLVQINSSDSKTVKKSI
jgi:hypothetical protein